MAGNSNERNGDSAGIAELKLRVGAGKMHDVDRSRAEDGGGRQGKQRGWREGMSYEDATFWVWD